jgi:hypothetical protein
MVKSGTRGITPKTCSSSGEVLRSFIESFLSPTSRAGTLQLDAGTNLEENTKIPHNPFILFRIISTGPHEITDGT